MKKRMIGALLALVMTIGVLAGCGGPSKLNKEEDFDVYKDGKLVQELGGEYYGCSIDELGAPSLLNGPMDDLNFVQEDSLIGAETKRGIKLGSTLEDICEVYSGEEIVLMKIFFEDRNKDTIYESGRFRDLLTKYETEIEEADNIVLSFNYYEKDGKWLENEELSGRDAVGEYEGKMVTQEYNRYAVILALLEGEVSMIDIYNNWNVWVSTEQ